MIFEWDALEVKSPFAFALGLILLAAAAGGFVGPLYAESAESCGSLLLPEEAPFCDPYEQRRRIELMALVACALPLLLAGLNRVRGGDLEHHRVNVVAAAAAGLLTLPVALMILLSLAVLNLVAHGFTQAYTGVPYIFAPAALALGALVAARLAVRAGADAGVALAAVAVALPLVLSVQAVAEAFRWTLDDLDTPLLLSGPFSYNQPEDAATMVTLALAALPVPLILGAVTWSRRQMPAALGAGLLFLSTVGGTVLFESSDDGGLYSAASIRWLLLLLVPAGLAVFALHRQTRQDNLAQHTAAVNGQVPTPRH